MERGEYLDPRRVPFGGEITGIIKEFAETLSLVFLPYYHDVALWIIHENESKLRVVRQVQVGAFDKAGDFLLSFVPSVYRLNIDQRKMTLLRNVPSDLVRTLSFKQLARGDAFKQKLFTDSLEATWQATKKLRNNIKDSGDSSGAVDVKLSGSEHLLKTVVKPSS